ncbi:MAG: ATP-binding protein, partial [Saprospiraceae bacterium]|nr:ATP-binding protein [Saprospiraceae bacterium]
RLDPDNGTVQRYLHSTDDPSSLSSNPVRCVYVDRQGTLWVGTGNHFNIESKEGGLNKYLPEDDSFERFLTDPDNPQSLANDKIRAIFEDSKGNFWIGAGDNCLQLMDRASGEFQALHPDNPEAEITVTGPYPQDGSLDPTAHITFIQEDAGGRLWIGAWRGGLNIWDPTTNTQQHFEPYDEVLRSNPNYYIWNMCLSRDETVWLATAGGGKEVLKVREDTDFLHYKKVEHLGFILENLNQFSESRDGASYWITSESDGLVKISGDETTRYLAKPHGSLSSYSIYSILGDEKDNLWLVMGNAGGAQPLLLDYFEPVSGEVTHFRHESVFPYTSSWTNTYRELLQDDNGTLWITSLGAGLISFDPSSALFREYRHDPDDQNSITNDMIFSIYQDDSGLIWIGGGGAPVVSYFCFLDRLDPTTGTVTHFPLSPALNNSYILGIEEDAAGNIWFALYERGIGKLNPETGQVTYFNENNGNIPQDDIRSFVKDQEGNFWMGTETNLLRFDPATDVCSSFEPSSRIGNVNFKMQSIHVGHSGSIYVGANDGYFTFSPDDITTFENPRIPKITITSFFSEKSRGEAGTVEILPVWNMDDVKLSYQDNSFSIEFSCLEFEEPSNTRYEYRLNPYNENWKSITGMGSAQYVNVPAGSYVFEVRGARNDGIWSETLSLPIRIKAPWWRSWWAIGSYILAIGGLLYLIRYLEMSKQKAKMEQQEERIRQEKEINEKLRRIDRLKDQFLANTSHELRTPLQGIIGLSEALYSKSEDAVDRENLSMVISSGKRLSSLVNDILDFSKLKNADINLDLKPVDMRALTGVVLTISRPLVMEKNVKLINAVEEGIPLVEGDENRLYQIMHNLIDNARKFTESGHVRISASEDDGMVRMAIEDTGIGIPENKMKAIFEAFQQADGSISRQFAGTGLGLSVSKKLVELHGGRMWVESEVGKGSTFYFTLKKSDETVVPQRKHELHEMISRAESVFNGGEKEGEIPAVGEKILGSNQIRILIVDDEPINHQVLKNHLSQQYYQLTHTMNGQEALNALEKDGPFDLVLLDIMMPHMSGYEVCERIREKHPPNELPILMISAKNQVEDLVEGLNTGANDYIVKPFSKNEFLARLKTHLNLHLINAATNKFIPSEFLQALGYENVTDVVLGDHALRNVTVMFTDIRDYTSLAEHLTPEDNFGFINAYARRMGPIIKRYNGFINQYAGDGIMSIFPHTPDDALRAGIDMQQSIAHYNLQRKQKNRRQIDTGMGLDTGPLIMGIIGSAERNDATVISDTVNTASRMEGLTKFYGVHILASENTFGEIRDLHQFNYRFLGNVKPKGKEKVIKVYEFFDGEPDQIIQLKNATKDAFQAGLIHYYDRSFAEAVGHFKAVLGDNPND